MTRHARAAAAAAAILGSAIVEAVVGHPDATLATPDQTRGLLDLAAAKIFPHQSRRGRA